MTNELKRYYSDLRDKNYRLWQKRVEECEAKNPKFRALGEEPGRVMQQAGIGKITYAAAISRIGQINAERRNLLISLGLPSNYLDRIYTCPICEDKGVVSETGKPCICALKKEQEMMRSASSINDRETFAKFNEAIYSNEEQKKQALELKGYCERYVAAFPSPKRPNLFIVGQSGLGKSFFGNAIAYAAIEKGVRTVKTTAYQCIQAILSGLDTREDAARPYLSAELLILDDLGTEAMVPNITIETIFRILNERIASHLPTVIITNLSSEEIQLRYDERVSSRLNDTSVTAIVLLRGDNLRTRIR
jgi:DNA replication protein DnaC